MNDRKTSFAEAGIFGERSGVKVCVAVGNRRSEVRCAHKGGRRKGDTSLEARPHKGRVRLLFLAKSSCPEIRRALEAGVVKVRRCPELCPGELGVRAKNRRGE